MNNLLASFFEKNKEFGFATQTIAVYIYLVYISECIGSKDIEISDGNLGRVLRISRPAINKARENLIEGGFVTVTPRSGRAPLYAIAGEIDKGKKKTVEKKSRAVIKKIEKRKDIPELEEFMSFAQDLPEYNSSMRNALVAKYNEWKRNNWQNNQGRPIIDYKATLKSVLPFLSEPIIPNINRP